MNDSKTHDPDLELRVNETRSEYLKPKLEVLENYLSSIGVTISIGS